MREPGFSFISHREYIKQERDKIAAASVRNNEVYIAVSPLKNADLDHEAVSFPVKLIDIAYPAELLRRNPPMATIAMRMVLLDSIFREATHPVVGSIKDGSWGLERAVKLQETRQAIQRGYLLLPMPDDPFFKN